MAAFERVKSGIPGLDEALDNIRLGDNVVWNVTNLNEFSYFVNPYVKQAKEDNRNLIYIRFANHSPLIEMSEEDFKLLEIEQNNPDTEFCMIERDGIKIYLVDPYKQFETFTLEVHRIIEKEGFDAESISLHAGIFGAEMWTEEMRHSLEEKLGITAHNIYGLTELMGPGVSTECEYQTVLHIQEDHFYPEIIDSETGETLEDGQKGELVLTNLTREGMPVIRFRTKDITALRRDECPCGRTTVRMDRITGRSDDMLKIKGVMVYPSQIEAAILQIEGLTANYQIHVSRPKTLDEIEVKVETSPEVFSDELKKIEEFERRIARKIQSAIGISVDVTLVEPESLPRSEGKAIRVIDERNFD